MTCSFSTRPLRFTSTAMLLILIRVSLPSFSILSFLCSFAFLWQVLGVLIIRCFSTVSAHPITFDSFLKFIFLQGSFNPAGPSRAQDKSMINGPFVCKSCCSPRVLFAYCRRFRSHVLLMNPMDVPLLQVHQVLVSLVLI